MMMFFFSCLLPYRLAFFLLLDVKDVYYMILWDARNYYITVISATKVIIIRNITIALHKHAESESTLCQPDVHVLQCTYAVQVPPPTCRGRSQFADTNFASVTKTRHINTPLSLGHETH